MVVDLAQFLFYSPYSLGRMTEGNSSHGNLILEDVGL
ncbi:hypothetical protein SAMN05421640_2990 [Ekhidna lutea]|uniref:Uncharacterized protein n=1 Tax=Ekhidna lutea TaxID=447679 RepID=A0A239L6R5_EKHLU|nr:hypothetical protein SAMN05421640_2990 [Ekhidna lutea]